MVHGGIGTEPPGTTAGPRLGRLDRVGARRRWWVLAAPRRVHGSGDRRQQAVDLLAQRFPAQNLPNAQVVLHAKRGTTPPTVLEETAASLGRLEDVRSVAPPQVSKDGTIAVLNVVYRVPFADLPKNTLTRLEQATSPARAAGVSVDYGGPVVDLLAQQSSASDHADEIGLAFAVVTLLFVFGTVVAAALPLTTAVIGVSIATAIPTLLATVMTVGTVAPILGTMIGLGVGIDYSLLVVSRFRQNRAEGMDVEAAVGRADHDRGVPVLRHQPAARGEDDRPRSRGGGRRDDRAPRPRARDHGAARRRELVVPDDPRPPPASHRARRPRISARTHLSRLSPAAGCKGAKDGAGCAQERVGGRGSQSARSWSSVGSAQQNQGSVRRGAGATAETSTGGRSSSARIAL